MRAVHPHLLKNISRKSYVALLPVLPDEAKINVFESLSLKMLWKKKKESLAKMTKARITTTTTLGFMQKNTFEVARNAHTHTRAHVDTRAQ